MLAPTDQQARVLLKVAATAVASYLFGQLIGAAPGSGHVVGAGKWVLSRIVSPRPKPPTTATARLRADPTGKSIAGLPVGLTERGADGRPQIKDVSMMTSSEKYQLQFWAEQTGGTDYLKTYAGTFRSYYGLGEKIEDGPDGLTN